MNNQLRSWTLFIDGGYRLDGAHEYTPPELAVTKLDIRTGGMDAPMPVDDGMEAMTCSFKLYGCDAAALALFGMRVGGRSPRLTAYEGYMLDGTAQGKIDEMEGIITKITPDARPNSNFGEAALTLEMSLSYYRSSFEGLELFEIIPAQFVRRVNGINVLEGLASKIRL